LDGRDTSSVSLKADTDAKLVLKGLPQRGRLGKHLIHRLRRSPDAKLVLKGLPQRGRLN